MKRQQLKKILSISSIFAALFLLSACGIKYPDPGKISMDGQSTGTPDVNIKDTQQNPTMNLTNDEVRKAAEAGDPDAQYALGYMYYYGKGVPQNKAAGESWINKSAAAGQPQAIQAQKILASSSQGSGNVAANSINASTAQQTQTQRQNNLKTALNNDESNNYASGDDNSMPASASATVANSPAVARDQGESDASTADSSNAATPAKVSTGSNLSQSSITLSELKTAPKNSYTVQLLGAYDQKDVSRYIQNHRLQGKVATYRTIRNGRDWYVVVYGLYGSYKQAETGIKALPAVIQAQRPWINKVSNVQASIDKPEATR